MRGRVFLKYCNLKVYTPPQKKYSKRSLSLYAFVILYIFIHIVHSLLLEETSTLSVNKKSDDGSSYEILKISKGSWGMKSILNEFETCLEESIGKQQIQAFKRDLSSEYNYLIEEFERKLKTVHDVQRLLIRIPFNILQWVKDHTLSSMEETINCSEYSMNIKMACDKMILSKNVILLTCEKTVNRIIEHIKTVLTSDMEDVETILLFGSLSEVVVVQNAVREIFKTKDVIVLHENAVLSGAVHLRHATGCQTRAC